MRRSLVTILALAGTVGLAVATATAYGIVVMANKS